LVVIGDFLDLCDWSTNRDVPYKVHSSAITYQGRNVRFFSHSSLVLLLQILVLHTMKKLAKASTRN